MNDKNKVLNEDDNWRENKYLTRARVKQVQGKSGDVIITENLEENKSAEVNHEEKPIRMSTESELSELIKALTAKVHEEKENNKSSITIETFAKIIGEYDGRSIPVKKWFEIFEENASAYELSDKQMYVHARNKINGVAKTFIESESVCNYEQLKQKLIEEFDREYDSFEVHRMLSNTRKKKSESFYEYILNMKRIANLAKIEERATVRYIVDGINISDNFKVNLYNAKTFKELREQFEIYEHIMQRETVAHNKDKHNTVNNNFVDKQFHCFNCGSKTHQRSECKVPPKCFKCNQFGHISKDCKAGRSIEKIEKNVNAIQDQKRFKVVRFNGVEIECLIDTGADVSLIKETVYSKNFGNLKLLTCHTVLLGLGNIKTKPKGLIGGEICVDNVKSMHEFLVVEDQSIKYDAIIGYDFVRKFVLHSDDNGFMFRNKNEEQLENELSIYNMSEIDVDVKYKKHVEKLVNGYKVAEKIETCPVTMKIIPDTNMKPFRHSPSRLSIEEEDAVNKQVEEWQKTGIVKKSFSDTASRVVVVKKKCGEYRVCIDYRQLNRMVLKDAFPVPVVEDVLQKLQKAKYFNIMDLRNGFFHVPVEKSSKKFTAFVTRRGLFEFNKAPFGFCNSPASFVRYINHIFQDLINEDVMELYIDDVVVFAETAEDCYEKLKLVLQTAARYGLEFNWKKCAFMKPKIEFLGHVVENGTITPGKDKCKAVKNFPTPKNIKDVQSFLGLSGYFRKFVEGYAQIVRPLTDLLKKDTVFKIGSNEINAINIIKQKLCSEPVLRIYSREAETELHTDASKNGFGAVILQKFNGQFYPVFFWSKKASVHESKLHSYILEVKAVYLSLRKFRHYLLGVNFKLITDCSAFKQTVEKKDVPRDVAQWMMFLQEFSYIVEHRVSSRMKHVDSLSRYPVDIMIVQSEITSRLRKLQQCDDKIKAILAALQVGVYDGYKIKGGLVYKNVDANDVLVVPKSMESEIIREAHNNGHFSVAKTVHNIKQQYFIPHVEKKVEQCIQSCIQCIMHNKKFGKREGYLQCIEKGEAPLCTLHIDHLGPMDSTAKQYKYIFAMVDAFSKFAWLFATKTTNAEEVIKNIKIWSDTFGFPKRIISDRGGAFSSNSFSEFCEESGIEHILTTTGVPRGNGQIERHNRTVLSVISKISSDDPAKWYKHMGQVQKTINSCLHSTTKSTPFEILFGTKMYSKINGKLLATLEEELVNSFDAERNRLRIDVKHQIFKAQEKYKNQYDKKCKDFTQYKVGDLVAIRRTQFIAGKKLANEYLGPYQVTKVKRGGRYDVKKAAEFEGPCSSSTSCDYMKRWRQTAYEDESWSSGSDESQDGRM